METKEKIHLLEIRVTELKKENNIDSIETKHYTKTESLKDVCTFIGTIIATPIILMVWLVYSISLYYNLAKDFYYHFRFGKESYEGIKIKPPKLCKSA